MARRREININSLVQHIDGRQGRVKELGIRDSLPAALVRWFRGGEEWVALGYIYATSIEETD